LENPYKYTGPLDPDRDKIVSIPRTGELNQVIPGILKGDYWAVFGPRQIGKTTFLHQVAHEIGNAAACCMYFDLEIPPATEENFYQWLMDKFLEQIPCQPIHDLAGKWKHYIPELRFFNFLEKFKPNDDNKRIVLFFDEIERIPSIKNFLHTWRRLFHERVGNAALKKYVVVISGSADLISLTVGPTSPFNIARRIYLRDFTREESLKLIDGPFKQLNIEIEQQAKQELVTQAGGHPQLLQHACHLLVNTAMEEERALTARDVEAALNVLSRTNTALELLERDLESDDKLACLVKDLLAGKKKKFFPYKKYAVTGAGAIVEYQDSCMIRNGIFEKFLRDTLDYSELSSAERYKKICDIGRGAMGAVYKAEDVILQRIVSLKILKADLIKDNVDLERFYSEARAAAQLFHPNIVMVYDVGRTAGDHFIAMEFIEGIDLMALIERKYCFTLPQILYIAVQLLKALEHSHRKGVVHRDIKPKNIMINREGEIKIVDFGIAAIKDHYRKGDTGYIIGSPYYISPEQIKGEQNDPRIDIYSTGVTLFHLAVGKVPFEGKDILLQHLSHPVPRVQEFRPEFPGFFQEIIDKCMAKDKEERYQDAQQVLTEIEKQYGGFIDQVVIKEELKRVIGKDWDKTQMISGDGGNG
jgi:tRNA A-37 threonylcarbamoyl transferase component Bud32